MTRTCTKHCGHSIQTHFGEDTFHAWLPRPTTKVRLERHVVENWSSLVHLKAHGAAPHMAAYAARIKDLIANRVIDVVSPGGGCREASPYYHARQRHLTLRLVI